jgi:hypothetical protein
MIHAAVAIITGAAALTDFQKTNVTTCLSFYHRIDVRRKIN